MDIGTNSRAIGASPSIHGYEPKEQLVTTKPISPLKGGKCFKIILLHVQTFTIFTSVITKLTTIVEPVEGSVEFVKDQVEHPPFTIFNSRV
jgi:hypothetical protein